jgi:hypothetical protein
MISPGQSRKRLLTRPARAPQARPGLEPLESRTVPYAASGNAWPHPELITLSFVPDGTDLGGQSSNLFSTFNSAFGSASAWQNVILKAAQTWAQQANINFAVVNDSGADSGSGSYQQGDPNFGDIRIGGFDFGDSSTLAMGYLPPQINNYSVAGDIAFNTAQIFNINGLDYDLYTVALHELGHALGLDHSTNAAAIMYPVYQGVEYGLYSDDVSGVQSIYGAPVPDSYDAAASNNTIGTASDINSTIDPVTLTAVLSNLNITSASGVDYYQFTAPSGGSGSLALTVQSTGLSLLAPGVRVYNSAQKVIASTSGSGDLGATLSLNVSVTAGQTYYIRVAGANSSAFGVGAYGMVLNLGTGASPTLSPPNTQTANGTPLSGGGGMADHTGSSKDYDRLTIGEGHFEVRTASPASPLPQLAAPRTVQAATPVIPIAAPPAVLTPADRGTAAPPSGAPAASVPTITVVETTTRAVRLAGDAAQAGATAAPASAAGIAAAAQDDAAEAPVPPAESRAPAASPEAIPIDACDAYFGDAGWREDAAASVLPPHGPGLAAGAGEPAALAAVSAFALAPAWGSRPAPADSRRRPALPR